MNILRPKLRSISINGRFLSQPITGVQRYAFELLSALDRLLHAGALEQIPVTVFVPPDAGQLPLWSHIRIRQAGRFAGQLWEQIDLPVHARGTLLFTPCGGAPLVHPHHVITIHDAGPFSTPGAYTAGYRTYYKFLHKILASAAVQVLTVSEFSKQELLKFLRLPKERVTCAWLSGEHILRCKGDDSVLRRNALHPGRYTLAVGSKNPNKNLRGLVQAAAHLPPGSGDLVVAGGINRSVFADKRIAASGVKELGFVNDDELRALYENAACFVFPSFYEGFGLPPLEALTLGCPVVVSRAASLPEVFGDAAVYCDPHSPADIACQISRVLQGEHPDRTALLNHAARFTWEVCARKTWEILANALVVSISNST